jgi:hypothetical protein
MAAERPRGRRRRWGTGMPATEGWQRLIRQCAARVGLRVGRSGYDFAAVAREICSTAVAIDEGIPALPAIAQWDLVEHAGARCRQSASSISPISPHDRKATRVVRIRHLWQTITVEPDFQVSENWTIFPYFRQALTRPPMPLHCG